MKTLYEQSYRKAELDDYTYLPCSIKRRRTDVAFYKMNIVLMKELHRDFNIGRHYRRIGKRLTFVTMLTLKLLKDGLFNGWGEGPTPHAVIYKSSTEREVYDASHEIALELFDFDYIFNISMDSVRIQDIYTKTQYLMKYAGEDE